MATSAGGTATVVRDGESGYLAPVGDTPALAARLHDARHATRARALARRGRGARRAGDGSPRRRMADAVDALYRRLLAALVKVLHIHKITGVSGSERHLLTLLPALRERGVDARFLGLDVPGTDAPRFYRELAAARRPVRARPLHARREPAHGGRAWSGPSAASRPDLLHTHLVHGDIYGSIASQRDPGAVRLLPPQRRPLPARAVPATSTALFARRRAPDHRDLGCRAPASWSGPASRARSSSRSTTASTRLPDAPSERDAGRARDRARRAARCSRSAA